MGQSEAVDQMFERLSTEELIESRKNMTREIAMTEKNLKYLRDCRNILDDAISRRKDAKDIIKMQGGT